MQLFELMKSAAEAVMRPAKQKKLLNVVRPELRALTKSTNKALLLNQLMYLQRVSPDGWVNASAAKLANLAQLDCSERTVRRYLDQFEAAGWLTSQGAGKSCDRSHRHQLNMDALFQALYGVTLPELGDENQADRENKECPMDAAQCLMEAAPCPMQTDEMPNVFKEVNTKKQQDTEAAAPAVVFEDELSKTAAAELQSIGVAAPVAAKLVKEHGPQACLQQLEWLPLRSPKNPAAVLVRAISQRWEAPTAAVSEAKTQETAATSSALARFLSVLSVGSVLVSIESGKRYVVERIDQAVGYARAVLEGTRQDVMICDKNFMKVALA